MSPVFGAIVGVITNKYGEGKFDDGIKVLKPNCNNMNESLQAGDWVNSYSKGIYRIEKIIDRYYDESDRFALEDKKIGDKYDDRLVLSKRFLNSKFGKSFGYESCSEFFVSHLDKEQIAGLDKVVKTNPGLLIDFDNYQAPPYPTLFNLPLQIDNKKDLAAIESLILFIKTGKTFLEIEKEMKRLKILNLIPEFYGNYNFQLINYNDEYVNKRKIWRNVELYKNNR